MRKIVQIAETNGHYVVGLCNDGSVLVYNILNALPDNTWQPLPDIPQPKNENIKFKNGYEILFSKEPPVEKYHAVGDTLDSITGPNDFDINKTGRTVPVDDHELHCKLHKEMDDKLGQESLRDDILSVYRWMMHLKLPTADIAKELLRIVPDLADRIKREK